VKDAAQDGSVKVIIELIVIFRRRGFFLSTRWSRAAEARILPERFMTRAKSNLRSFNLEVGNLEPQNAQGWSRAHPARTKRTVSSTSRQALFERLKPVVGAGGFHDIFRALWRRGREVCSRASRRGVHPHASAWARGAGARGDILGAVGVGDGAKRSEICSPATCEVLLCARRRARAQRRTICSPARCSARVGMGEGAVACRSAAWRRGDVFLGACRCGRRCGRLQVHSLASWRCVPQRVSAWAKARWHAGPQPGVWCVASKKA